MKIETTAQQDEVLAAMHEAPEWASPKEIAARSGVNINTVRSYLLRFAQSGLVKRKGRGRYKIAMIEDESPLESEIMHASKRVAEPPPSYASEKLTADAAMIHVPLASVQASAGNGSDPFQEEIEAYVSYDRDQIRRELGANPERLLVIPITGDSMEPTLRPGERVLVLKYQGEPIYDSAIYVLHGPYKGVLVKRVRWQQDGSILLVGDNAKAEQPAIIIRPGEEEEWRIIGRVLRVERSL